MILNNLITRIYEMMVNNMMQSKTQVTDIKNYILIYLKKKGKIRACLLSKIIKDYCYRKNTLPFQISKEKLIQIIIEMVKSRIIDIVIPQLFDIYWRKRFITDFKFFKEGTYYISEYRKVKDILDLAQKNNYFFDSRKLDFKRMNDVNTDLIKLKELIEDNPNLEKKVIVYYPKNSLPLNIYENNPNIKYRLFDMPLKLNLEKLDPQVKLLYPIKNQRIDLGMLGKYRHGFMCFYIPLIESIQKKIVDLQNSPDQGDKSLMKDYVVKFTYYCQNYVDGDWFEISEPNPARWETFFQYFQIPIENISYTIHSIAFHGKTFEIRANLVAEMAIKTKDTEFIAIIQNKGLKVVHCSKDCINVCLEVNFYLPCPSIEYFYFIAKYFCFYHLFMLFNYCFPYITINPEKPLISQDRALYKIFLPTLKNLFRFDEKAINNEFFFKYYTLNPEELEVIYNKFLLNNIRSIEKKLYTYFMLRCTK